MNECVEYANYIDEFCLKVAEERKMSINQVKEDVSSFITDYLNQNIPLKEIVEVGLKWFDVYYHRYFEPFGIYINY